MPILYFFPVSMRTHMGFLFSYYFLNVLRALGGINPQLFRDDSFDKKEPVIVKENEIY